MNPIPPIHAGEEFQKFWNAVHPHSLSEYGFNNDDNLHYAFQRRDSSGAIDSAMIFIPCFRGETYLGHHVHLCSRLHSKALFSFCRGVMETTKTLDNVTYLCAETQGIKEYIPAGRVAKGLGFEPVYIKHMDCVDYVWNSKAA